MPDPSAHQLIFDVTRHTHLASHLRFLIEYRNAHPQPGTLSLVVARHFPEDHPDIVALAALAPYQNIHLITLTDAEQEQKNKLAMAAEHNAPSFTELVRADEVSYPAAYDWELFRKYVAELNATHGFIIHLDAYLPLFTTPLQISVPLSGIYFAPTFHYSTFHDSYTDARLEPKRMMREKFVLARALRDPHIARIFFFDPFAVAPVSKFASGDKAAFLPDPLDTTPATTARLHALEMNLGIEPGRKTFLFFGELTARKGIRELFDALDILPADAARQMCLLIAGRSSAARRAEIQADASLLRARSPIQIIERIGYVPHADVAAYFQRADVVLAPYPQHDGMSGVSLLAAAFEKPVLSSAYGVMGEMTRRYNLGLTVDVTNPAAIAAALERMLREDAASYCDLARMRQIGAEHRAEHFARAILEPTR